MKRFPYKINGSFHTTLPVGTLRPSFFYEVSPGESWSGSMDISGISAPTNGLVMNRMFLDHFTFYVPYRVLWEEWPQFISGGQTGNTNPPIPSSFPSFTPMMYGANPQDIDENLGDGFNQFWCKQKTHADPDSPDVFGVNALPVWAYYLIWNTCFRPPGTNPLDYPVTTPSTLAAFYRNNDYFVRWSEQYSSSGALDTTNVDTFRNSLAKDMFDKTRLYYGDKYTDFLRALGVSAQRSLVDEPELLGMTKHKMQYRRVSNLAGTQEEPLGEKSGYYEANFSAKIKKSFFPEHGIIMGVYALRPEAPIVSASHPSFAKGVSVDADYDSNRSSYWSPEFDAKKQQHQNPALVVQNDATSFSTANIITPNYLDLKSGFNLSVNDMETEGNTVADYMYTRSAIAHTDSVNTILTTVQAPTESAFQNMFLDIEIDQGVIGLNNITKLSKLSPISKIGNYLK